MKEVRRVLRLMRYPKMKIKKKIGIKYFGGYNPTFERMEMMTKKKF